jgi:hypothetical protein
MASMLPETVGVFDYAFRYSTTGGRDWLYADLNGTSDGYSPADAGSLTVVSSGDTTAPSIPTNLIVVASSPTNIDLDWDDVMGDPSLYGYEVMRSDTAGGPYMMIARVTASSFSDTSVQQDETYFYVVLALDNSFNRSGPSNEVQATASPRTVSVTFNVEVPPWTPTGWSVYIAGTLSRLDGGFPDWDEDGAVMAMVDATHWTITFTGKEGVQVEYKYTLGSWNYVEKGATCEEIANRSVILSYGAGGTQTVNDLVLNWRNLNGCPN